MSDPATSTSVPFMAANSSDPPSAESPPTSLPPPPTMATPEAQRQFSLITENLAEVLNPEIIETILNEGRHLKVYWGTAPTGRPHCGYFVPMLKLAQFLSAGCEITCLLADVHAFLDSLKSPLDLVAHRTAYYRFTICAMLDSLGVPLEKLRFVQGSSYQQSAPYALDVYKLSAMISEHDARRAGAEIVKQSDNGPLSGLLYPLLQVLDEQYLGVDAQFGGVDQRKLFIAAKDWLPRLGYKERAHLMNPMVPGLRGGKMSASDPDSKIDILDPPDVTKRKIKKAVAAPGVIEDNGLLAFAEFVLLPAAALQGKREFVVPRERDGLPPLVYTDVESMQADYKGDVLTPQLLKESVTTALNALLAPVQARFNANKEWQEAARLAYPPEEKVKVKKVKKVGTFYPGKGAAEGKVGKTEGMMGDGKALVDRTKKGAARGEGAGAGADGEVR